MRGPFRQWKRVWVPFGISESEEWVVGEKGMDREDESRGKVFIQTRVYPSFAETRCHVIWPRLFAVNGVA